MPRVPLRQLLEAGVHFGHQTSRWNPRMQPYIFTARNGIHVINLEKTQSALESAYNLVRSIVARGDKVLFVGTKKQAQDSIEECCNETGQFFVTHRWMGGMLTNYTVIQKRLQRLAELRALREAGDFERMTRKEANVLEDELDRLERNFRGMAHMTKLPGALFVVDCKKERLAIAEANRMNVPIIAITDTNCNPDPIQHVIPGNDDAIRSVKLIIGTLTEAIREGQEACHEREEAELKEIAARSAEAEREAAQRAKEAKAEAAEAEQMSPMATSAEGK